MVGKIGKISNKPFQTSDITKPQKSPKFDKLLSKSNGLESVEKTESLIQELAKKIKTNEITVDQAMNQIIDITAKSSNLDQNQQAELREILKVFLQDDPILNKNIKDLNKE